MGPTSGVKPASVHAITFQVGEGDIDELGHASNIAYVRWIQDVALSHSTAVGLGLEAYGRLGAVFVVRRHEIDYLRPVLRGQRLEVRTWIDSAAAAQAHRATEIVRVDESGGEVPVARAMTVWGFIDMTSGRPTRIPDEVRVAFGHSPVARAVRESISQT